MHASQIQDFEFRGQVATLEDTIEYLVNPPKAVQLPDWNYFNTLIGGFRMKEFSILCGPTGSGKTTWLANLSAQLIEQDVKHFVMSIETGRFDYMARVMSVISGRDLNLGCAIDRQELMNIFSKDSKRFLKESILFSMHETRLSIEQLKHEIRTAVEIHGCKIVFIDNLNYLLEVKKANDAIAEMDRVVHDLIEFVKTCEVHIVMVMHPKKTEDGRVISEFDIKGSSTSVQEAQNVFLFNRPRPKDKESEPTDRELLIAKMRRRGTNVGVSIVYRNMQTRYIEKGYR